MRHATRTPGREGRFRTDRALQRRHLAGDRAAKDELIERHLPLARQLARRFGDRPEPLGDLIQVAYVGLLGAVERWDPERGTAFSSFAVPTILGQLRRHFRDNTWLVRPTREVQELYLAVGKTREALWQELGQEPTAADVAGKLGVPIEEVLEALQAGGLRSASVSLDEPLRHDDSNGATVLDWAADPRDEYAEADASVALDQLTALLDTRSRDVVQLRYRDDLLQREIAERVGCSQMHVSRILDQAIKALQLETDASPPQPGP